MLVKEVAPLTRQAQCLIEAAAAGLGAGGAIQAVGEEPRRTFLALPLAVALLAMLSALHALPHAPIDHRIVPLQAGGAPVFAVAVGAQFCTSIAL